MGKHAKTGHKYDGPINLDYKNYSTERVAANLLRSIGSFGWWMYQNDETSSLPQGYRISSWLEDEPSNYGHAFGTSAVTPIRTDFGGYKLTGRLWTTDVDNIKLTEEPKDVSFATDMKIDEALESVVDTFTKEEMAIACSILRKMRSAVLENDFGADIDKRVSLAINLHNLDSLSEAYPS